MSLRGPLTKIWQGSGTEYHASLIRSAIASSTLAPAPRNLMLKDQYFIMESQSSPEQLTEALRRIGKGLGDTDPTQAVIGCLAMAIILQKPDMPIEQLPDVVMQVSKYVCLLLTGTDTVGTQVMN